MGDDKSKRYLVKDRKGRVEGFLTQAQILHRISKDRYNGNEEVSVFPFKRWQKLSSIPAFYDPLLKKLHGQAVKDLGAGESKPKESGGAGADIRPPTLPPIPENPLQALTTHIPADGLPQEERSIDPSVMEELFSDPSLDLAQMKPGERTKVESEVQSLDQPLDISNNVKNEENPLPLKRLKARRRLFVWGAVLGTLLVVLFRFGDHKTETVDELSSQNSVQSWMAREPTKQSQMVATLAQMFVSADLSAFNHQAMVWYKRASEINPENVQAWAGLAEASARLFADQQSDSMEMLVEQALSNGRAIDPQYAQFYRAEAIVAIAKGEPDRAKELIASAVQSDPENVVSSVLLAEVLLTRGNLDEAHQLMGQALKIAPHHVHSRYLWALLYDRWGNSAQARSQAEQVLQDSPYHGGSYLLLGNLARKENQLSEAEESYRQGIKFSRLYSPTIAAELFFQLGTLLEITGNRPQAVLSFTASAEREPRRRDSLASEKRLGDLAESRAWEKEQVWDAPNFADAGKTGTVEKKWHRAAHSYLAAVALDPGNALALFGLGEVLETNGRALEDLDRATLLYEMALERDPSLVAAYVQLGLLETDRYRFDIAEAVLNRGLSVAGTTSKIYQALGIHFYKRQDYKRSLEYFRQAQQLEPNSSVTLYHAGLLLLKEGGEGTREEAANYFYGAYLANPDNYPALVEWLKLKVANYEKPFAIKFVNQLLEQDSENAKLYWAMAEVYASNKEYRRAQQYFHRSLDLDNKDSQVRLAFAQTLEGLGDLKKAVAEYRLAAILDPKSPEGYLRAAEILVEQKNYVESEKVLGELLQQVPNLPGARILLAKTYLETQREEMAVEVLREEVQQNPRNIKFQMELARVLIDLKKYEEALVPLSTVSNLPSVSQSPEFVYDKINAYLLLSRCYRALKRLESAEGAINLALGLDTQDRAGTLHLELGFIYAEMQRNKEAASALHEYLNRNPAGEKGAQVRKMLRELEVPE